MQNLAVAVRCDVQSLAVALGCRCAEPGCSLGWQVGAQSIVLKEEVASADWGGARGQGTLLIWGARG